MALKVKNKQNWEEIDEAKFPAPPEQAEYQFLQTFVDFQQGGKRRTLYHHDVSLGSGVFHANIDGKFVTVGLVGGYDNQGNPNPGEIRQMSFPANHLGGRLYLHPKADPADRDMYYALEVHPAVAGNSNPDTTTPKLMRKVDSLADAQKDLDDSDNMMEAMGTAATLKGADLERAAWLTGIDGKRDEKIVRRDLVNLAKTNPEAFMAKVKDEDGDIKADLAKALAANTVQVDHEAKKLTWPDGNMVLQLAQTDPASVSKEYAAFVRGDGPGAKLHEKVKALTNSAGAVKGGKK